MKQTVSQRRDLADVSLGRSTVTSEYDWGSHRVQTVDMIDGAVAFRDVTLQGENVALTNTGLF